MSTNSNYFCGVNVLFFVTLLFAQNCSADKFFLMEKNGYIPNFKTSALSEDIVEIPQMNGEKCNFYVFSFDDEQQAVAESWVKKLRSSNLKDTVWEVPIVGKQLPFLEGIIRRAMKKSRSEIETQRKTLPLFVDTEPLKKAFSIPDQKNVWVGVTNKEGKVIGSVSGAQSSENSNKLSAFLKLCNSQPNPDLKSEKIDKGSDLIVKNETIKTILPNELASIAKTEKLNIYDCNGSELYAEGHIPNARPIEFNQVTIDKLPKDKNSKLVFYCYNRQCSASITAAKSAVSLGYKNVYHLPDGITGWKAAGLPVESPRRVQ